MLTPASSSGQDVLARARSIICVYPERRLPLPAEDELYAHNSGSAIDYDLHNLLEADR
jgi:hypothetical protein